MSTIVISARVFDSEGLVAAEITYVPMGGGTQIKTIDGEAVEFVHPRSWKYHVQLISPDRYIPDILLDASSYEEAVAKGEAYATKLDAHKEQAKALADDLKMDA